MYFVITGSSDFAVELVRLLKERKENKIAVVIKKKDDALIVTEQTGISVVNADPANTDTLNSLELEKCDVFVSATESEKDNLLSAVYAKNVGVNKIFVLTNSPESDQIIEKLGLVPINAQMFAARSVELMINRPLVSELVNIGIGQFDIIEAKAGNTNLLDKEVCDAKGKCFTALAKYSDGKFIFEKNAKIKEQDTVLLLVKSGKEKDAQKEISKKNSSFLKKMISKPKK